jgi:acyl dehydratase
VKLPTSILGIAAGPRVQEIDARWLMAYAAALGHTEPEYFDTTRPDGIISHPLFPVCYEWPVALDLRACVMSEEIARHSVHATHDLRLHRRPRAGDRLSTTATTVSVEPTSPGAYVVSRFVTVDTAGEPVSTTHYGSIYRGVECDRAIAAGVRPDSLAAEPKSPPDWSATVTVAPTLAHVYTECARIWNPIHTDRAVARAVGLPDIILHGTATLALAVSTILEREGIDAGANLSSIACRFSGMVPLPSAIQVVAWRMRGAHDGRVIAFQALTVGGRAALQGGRLIVNPPGISDERSR